MVKKNPMRIPSRWMAASMLAILLCLPEAASTQEEVASAMRRYKERELSTGYYEQYEAKPRRMVPLVGVAGVTQGIFPYSPSAAQVRTRTRLADSHWGIKFYKNLRCEYCHVRETRDIHTVRANLTCRQCHGGEPIASLEHYYSPFNPIRKHAYVCSKCHEGSSASFASYVVHPPNPALIGTMKTFPALFYAFWIMIALAAVTFIIFLPHMVAWGIRELFNKKEKAEGEPKRK